MALGVSKRSFSVLQTDRFGFLYTSTQFSWWATTLIWLSEPEGAIHQNSQDWASLAPHTRKQDHTVIQISLQPDIVNFYTLFYFDLFIHSDYSTWTRFWHFDTLISSLTGKPTLIVSKTVRLLLKLLLATNLNACYQQGRKPANFMLKRVFTEWVFDLGN